MRCGAACDEARSIDSGNARDIPGLLVFLRVDEVFVT
jgi:hypothetical protein